jgi:excisionase family DNA binding protein
MTEGMETLAGAADRTGMSRSTLRRWMADGYLIGYRFGVRSIRVRVEDVDRLAREIPTVRRVGHHHRSPHPGAG